MPRGVVGCASKGGPRRLDAETRDVRTVRARIRSCLVGVAQARYTAFMHTVAT